MMMWIKTFITEHWQRKLVALIAALIIWFLVAHSITVTKTFFNIPVRIINLPQTKTIDGLLPTGFLKKRISLTLSGNKDGLALLDSSDLQVIIDAKNRGDNWIAKIGKKSLFTTNPSIDLSRIITEVSQNELMIRLTPLVTEKIPIYIKKPIGNPPAGYQFLDIWPKHLTQTLSGPEEQIHMLQTKGFVLTFDLSNITSHDLDSIPNHTNELLDEVSYYIPNSWKYVTIPFQDNAPQKINDPAAESLRIDFLRDTLLPLDSNLPISIFFPLQTSQTINPQKDFLAPSPFIEEINGIPVLKMPLFAKGVSKVFLDIVRNHLEIIIIAAPENENAHLQWAIQCINTQALENDYVAETVKELAKAPLSEQKPTLEEEHLRNRFRHYLTKLEFLTINGQKLRLEITWEQNNIVVKDASTIDFSRQNLDL